jgi:hypothetical protein
MCIGKRLVRRLSGLLLVGGAAFILAEARVQAATALGNAFTYQGRLLVSLAPPNTPYDFQFTLFDSASGGVQVAGPITLDNVAVSNGLFTVSLDFGSAAFDGNNRYLAIGVRDGASTGSFTLLAGRQLITATPYALYAKVAGVAAAVTGTVKCARKKYYMTSSFPDGASADSACIAGYHFASFAEIMDPSNLDYAQNGIDVPAGTAHTLPDSGKGPPFSSLAWVRTGVTGANNAVAGNANCIVGGVPWSSNSSLENGTVIALKPTWTDAPSNVSPWDATVRRCDNPSSPAPQVHAWCVED